MNKKFLKSDLAHWLNQAAGKGNLPRLKKLLDSGADINAHDRLTGFRPLISAAAKGRLGVAKFLLSSGVSVDARVRHEDPTDYRGATALMLASHNNHKKLVELLLNAGANVNASTQETGLSTPIEFVAREGHLEIARVLLSAGAFPTREAFSRAAAHGHSSVLKEMLKGKKPKGIRFERGVVAHATQSAHVPKKHRMEILELLLDAGGNINGPDYFGRTALQNAVKLSDVNLLRWLIERRANVNKMTKMRSTVLHYAAFLGECECAKELIAAGANLNIKNSEGKTPLQSAVFYEQKEMVKLLKSIRC